MIRNKPVTALDVAKHAGVSRSAVSRAFTPHASISQETRSRILKAADELGYEVNILGRSLNKQRLDIMALIAVGMAQPFRAKLIETLVGRIQDSGFQAMITEVGEGQDLEDALQKLLRLRVAGAIVTSGTPPARFAEECLKLNIPVTVINRHSDLEGVDTVQTNNDMGAAYAAEILLEAGCKRLAYLNVNEGTFSGEDRGVAFVRAIAPHLTAGEIAFQRLMATIPDYDGGFAAARHQSESSEMPDGIFCANDLLALGYIDGMAATHGLRPPVDFKIVGFDDVPLAGSEAYGLTTIRQDIDAIADAAVASVLERLEKPHQLTRVEHIPVAPIIRRSTDGLSMPASMVFGSSDQSDRTGRRLDHAVDLALRAGSLARRLRDDGLAIDQKGRADFVTEADRKIEELLRSELLARFAADGVLGEELGHIPGSDGLWVIDPIDGTSNYITGLDQWCISIAWVVEGEIEIGIIYAPDRQELFTARRGQGAFLNGRKLNVRSAAADGAAIVGIGSSNRVPLDRMLEAIRKLDAQHIGYRLFGSGALALAQVASGLVQGYFEAHINAWDAAAGLLMVEEAGGKTNNFLTPSALEHGNPILATEPKLANTLAQSLSVVLP